MPPLAQDLRAAANSVIFPTWTALCVSAGICAGAVTRDSDLFYRWQRHWARGPFVLCGIPLHVSGQQNMEPDRGYVVIANHSSYMDIPAVFASLPTLPSFFAKRELSRIPFLGQALRSGRHILVDRGSRSSARDTLERAAAHVRRGGSVLIFPEGTRQTRDAIGTFKSGAFRLAKLAQAPILPVGIRGTRHVLPKHGRLLRSHPVQLQIGAPISRTEVLDIDLGSLTRLCRAKVAELAGLPIEEATGESGETATG
ncbi:MAG TPA: lysophospholipid acyltransferase family protein [Polyangiaceae bacterium]|nr:lysophospholipid acyltransferase family protein [Polyangiaceae bacterium]